MSSSAPAVVSPPPGNPRFPLFDGLRAIAVLAVVATHASFAVGLTQSGLAKPLFANLDIGVSIFFAISGFLLYRPFVAADLRQRSMSTLRYARRRFLRIVPLYWIALTVLALVGSAHHVFTGDWWHFYFFAQVFSNSPDVRLGGIVQTWSLDLEVMFYIALPFYALIARRILGGGNARQRVRRDLAVLAAIASLSVLLRLLLLDARSLDWVERLPAFAGWFAIGMALAVISACSDEVHWAARVAAFVRRRTDLVAVSAALLYLAVCLSAPWLAGHLGSDLQANDYAADIGYFVVKGLVAGLLVSIAAFASVGERRSWPARLMKNRTLAWLGLISYGIFLWHMVILTDLADQVGVLSPGFSTPLQLAALVVFTAVGAVPVAAVSYYFIERPILKLKEPRSSKLAAAGDAPPPS